MAPGTLAAALLLASAALLAGCADPRPWPPCPQDWLEQPLEHTCLRSINPGAEACTVAVDGSANQEVVCGVASTDGKVALVSSLQGSGSSRVRVTDGDGVLQYDQTLGSRQSGTVPLAGARGNWTLQVDFLDPGGSGHITLYG